MSRLHVFRYRDFRLLWTGCLVSWTGSEMSVIALSWMLYQLTGSALSLGLLGLMRAIPTLALSMHAGSIADKYDRRLVILYSQVIMTVVALVVIVMAWTQTLTPLAIYLSVLIEYTALAYTRPARQSLVPELVPQELFGHAVQTTSTMWQGTALLGPAIAGIIMALYGPLPVLIINAASFVPFIICLKLMSPRPIMSRAHTPSQPKSSSPVLDGIRYVLSRRIIAATMILDFFVTFFAMAKSLFPIYADQVLHSGEVGLGLLHSSIAVGGVTAGLILNPGWYSLRQGKFLVWSVIAIGLTTILYAYSPWITVSCLLLVVLGAADFVSMNVRMLVRQLNTPSHYRGRVAGIHAVLAGGGPMLGEIEAGVMATLLGTQLSVLVGGILAIASVLVIARLVPEMYKYGEKS